MWLFFWSLVGIRSLLTGGSRINVPERSGFMGEGE
jgi:hypothetical protein